MNQLQEIIQKTLKLGRKTGTGFHEVVCQVCKDHKKRAGFLFKPDGTVVYNCFRGKCDASCVYTPGEKMSWKFKNLLRVYHVKLPPELLLQIESVTHVEQKEYDVNLFEPHFYKDIELPAHFIPYDPGQHGLARAYLEERFIDDLDYFVNHSQEYMYVPLRYFDKIIGYQSIKLDEKFYLRSRENTDLLYLPDGEIPHEPIIVEGIMDAKSVPFGVGTLQPTLSAKQAYILRHTDPIILPDKEGSRFMEVAKKYGWRVIIPSYKEKDTNKALKKFGHLVLAEILRDNVYSNYDTAKMKYDLWRAT